MALVLLYNLRGEKLRRVQAALLRHGLQGRGVIAPYFAKTPGYGAVLVEVRVHIDACRAQAEGFPDVHGGTDAVFAGLVAAGGHHAPLVGEGPDDQRLSAQGRVVPRLHGGVERVHIHMDDDPVRVPRLPSSVCPRRTV